MLTRGVPWQLVVTFASLLFAIFIVTTLLSLVSGYFGWHLVFTLFFIVSGFLIIILIIPLVLNLSRSFYVYLLFALLLHVSISIITFSLHYMDSGLIGPSGQFHPKFYDAIYFSITTFTTLGYGDLQPIPSQRLVTSVEALTGMLSMALGASLIWLWCQENLLPKEMALWDGNRVNKRDFTVSRIRVRTLTGKERRLKNWISVPEEGESFYYDSKKQEWIKIEKETKIPENSMVVVKKGNEGA